MRNIWVDCDGSKHITALSKDAWRLVEDQGISATRKLVDSLDEQALLENMIESVKPPILNKYVDLHPLLFTPFRYPPLKHGSRFGTQTEHSLWYGSIKLSTAMSEKAYYRFHFLNHIEAEFKDLVTMHLTAFSASIQTDKSVLLTNPPFSKYVATISSPTAYTTSQQLGNDMRNAHIEAFEYISARDPQEGINIGLFTPKAFANKNPNVKSFQSWECLANNKVVEFVRSSAMTAESHVFPIEMFMVTGSLPFPAD